MPLKNTFANRYGVAWQNGEALTASVGQPFPVYFGNFTGALDRYAFRRRDPGISAGHGDGLQQIDPSRTSIRHFVTARPVHLAQHCKTSLRVTEQQHVYTGIHQIVASEKVR